VPFGWRDRHPVPANGKTTGEPPDVNRQDEAKGKATPTLLSC